VTAGEEEEEAEVEAVEAEEVSRVVVAGRRTMALGDKL